MDVKGIISGVNPYLNPKATGAEGRDATDQAAKTGAQQAAATGDVVTISDAAKLQALATREATRSPDVRRDKVDEVKQKIQSGQYKPDSRKIAEGIVKSDLGMVVGKG
ncbi:MAG: flagellar biosynthesis anti-sigma factor FlgM [Desulfovibrionaceae bacterium]|nr:flagellar biosynthesis anti-sigma factor FlgM [Desulfovibrionaceae bacterium]MBF0514601.1 flagellar biosynthesis anti-sigma factor FlgM [Desulfovibrionaceae bacterium]